MNTTYALVLTGLKDPMWPFLIQECSEQEKERLLFYPTDDPDNAQCSYNPISGEIELHINNKRISGQEICSVWLRRFVPPELNHLDRTLREYSHREYVDFFEGLEIVLAHAKWVSMPTAINRARNKAYQLQIAHELGFTIPETIFTNSPSTLRIKTLKSPTIYKSIRSPRIITEDEKIRTVFTTLLGEEHLSQARGIATCPGILQDFVNKAADIRVTVFGDEVFSVLIESQANKQSKTDFRCNARYLEHRVHNLPTDTKNQCRLLVQNLGLKFGAIDLALMADNSYVFFEINPNGQWGWLEEKTGLPMRRALLKQLLQN